MKRTQIGLRLESEIVDQIDDFRVDVSAALPGADLSRSDAVRMLLKLGLKAHQLATQKPKKAAVKK